MSQNMTFIENVEMFCPICGKDHAVPKYRRETQGLVKDEAVDYREEFYMCEKTAAEENEFVSAKMMNENLLRSRDSYRKRHHLLTSTEIFNIRKHYGLSQIDFSTMLGWDETTVEKYETKAIQDEAHDAMMRAYPCQL